ncbi:hypothetical protein EX30DRAFT_160900 [Ascodesmis nigricans]|uniref:F-box domain-containing protein n=1 Tax=Ascodesmis nigricans TaxID=341454 RepID=A0A4S2MMD5_9PEZI|nr:hypothetical protein EX30DRAFT_160900 [Ascodesmis nigricans]
MLSLLDLPFELVLLITKHLDAASKHHLSLTNKWLCHIIGPVHMTKYDTFLLRLAEERKDNTRYRRVCRQCNRLRPFYHYSFKHSSSRKQATNRTCLDCLVSKYEGVTLVPLINWFLGSKFALCRICRGFVLCPFTCPFVDYDSLYCIEDEQLPRHECTTDEEAQHRIYANPGTDEMTSVTRMRSTLDYWDKKMPPRYFLAIRSKNSIEDLTWEKVFRNCAEYCQEEPEQPSSMS